MNLSRDIEMHLQFRAGDRVAMCESSDDASLIKVGGVAYLKESNEIETNTQFLKNLFEYGYTKTEDGAIIAFCRSFLLESKIHESQAKEWIDIFLRTSFEHIRQLAEVASNEQSFMNSLKKFKLMLETNKYETVFKTIHLDAPPVLEIAEEKHVISDIATITSSNRNIEFNGKITQYNQQENKLFSFISQLDQVLEDKKPTQHTKNQFNKEYGNFLHKIARYSLKGLLSENDTKKLQLKLTEYSTQIYSWGMKPQTKGNKSLFKKISHRLFKITSPKTNAVLNTKLSKSRNQINSP
jgi:hypothetical protein